MFYKLQNQFVTRYIISLKEAHLTKRMPLCLRHIIQNLKNFDESCIVDLCMAQWIYGANAGYKED